MLGDHCSNIMPGAAAAIVMLQHQQPVCHIPAHQDHGAAHQRMLCQIELKHISPTNLTLNYLLN